MISGVAQRSAARQGRPAAIAPMKTMPKARSATAMTNAVASR
jgi:hypothetical protein